MENNNNGPEEFRRIHFACIQPQDGWGIGSFQQEMASLIYHLAISAEMDNIAALDDTVSGDDQPFALEMIMGAYNKHKESQDE
jgi:hypothetical protein